MTAHDPAVRLETVAAAAGRATDTLRRARAKGRFPAPDALIEGRSTPACGWRLSTIRAWNPAVADRCARLIADPEPLPPMAA